jgi:hypothetical protein
MKTESFIHLFAMYRLVVYPNFTAKTTQIILI